MVFRHLKSDISPIEKLKKKITYYYTIKLLLNKMTPLHNTDFIDTMMKQPAISADMATFLVLLSGISLTLFDHVLTRPYYYDTYLNLKNTPKYHIKNVSGEAVLSNIVKYSILSSACLMSFIGLGKMMSLASKHF